ncbi:MAG: hypothetical protein J5809_05205 [Selenomonadaceae bacterium]|nr:hypothetical protein [Selenomonadaceae bacterium]
MATREENLKKINEELEKLDDEQLEQLSDEELDKVAGGTLREIADDSRFLNVLLNGTTQYHKCDRYSRARIFFNPSVQDDVIEAWKSLGVELRNSSIVGNEYIIDGFYVSQSEAWNHAGKGSPARYGSYRSLYERIRLEMVS